MFLKNTGLWGIFAFTFLFTTSVSFGGLTDPDVVGNLILAASHGELEAAQTLVEAGVDVNAAIGGTTPLHWAAMNGNTEIVQFLIEKKADLNPKESSARTPLHKAAIFGHVKVVKALLKAGAEIDVKDRDGRTPLDCAELCKHREVSRILREWEASK